MHLLWLHPNNDTYIKIDVIHMDYEVDVIFKERKKEIETNRNNIKKMSYDELWNTM